jgi:hypothetical protein
MNNDELCTCINAVLLGAGVAADLNTERLNTA